MFGNAAIFISRQPSVVLTGTPVLSNFHIENDQKSRVYFEASSNVTGLTKDGFVISGKTISSVIIDGDGLGGYFTVSAPFTFWDNNTIRLGEHDDVVESQPAILHDFTLEYITNNIAEPVLLEANYRYVTVAGAGSHNGTLGNEWTWLEATDNAVAGQTVWIKAGNYGTQIINQDYTITGTPSNPIKFIGYKTTPGDITSNYFTYGSTFSDTEMPTVTGANLTTGDGIHIWGGAYHIYKNIQVTGINKGISLYNDFVGCVIENSNIYIVGYSGSGIYSEAASKVRIKNTTITDYGMHAVQILGTGGNLFDNIDAVDSRAAYKADYQISVNGDNSIIRNCFAKMINPAASTHGIGIRGGDNVTSNSYNLIQNCIAENLNEGFYIRNTNVNYNVIKDCQVVNSNTTNSYRGGLSIWGDVNWNIVERLKVDDAYFGVEFKYQVGEDFNLDGATNNIIRNSIFNNMRFGITMVSGASGVDLNDNSFINCTINDAETLFSRDTENDIIISNLNFKNSIIKDSPVYSHNGLAITGVNFNNNIFWNNDTWDDTLIGTNGNIEVNPVFADLIDFVPTATFTDIDIPRIDGVWYDYNGDERDVQTTIGAVKHTDEIIVEEINPPVSYTPTYYVSYSGGSDTNNGLSEQTAWKTISKVNSEMNNFLPGDVIAFKKGDVWALAPTIVVDESGTIESPIVFTSYGTGAKPIIDATGVYTGTWTELGSNIWRTDTPINGNGRRLQINGDEALMSLILTDLGTNISISGTDPDGFVNAHRESTGHFRVYSTTTPAAKTIRTHGAARAIYVYETNNIVFHDLEIQGGYYHGVTVAECNNITFDNMKIGVMSQNGIMIAEYGGIAPGNTNIIIKNSLFDTEFIKDYGGGEVNHPQSYTEYKGSSDAIAVEDCTGGEYFNNVFKNWGHASVFLTSTNNATAVVENIKVYDNYFYMDPKMTYGGATAADRKTYNCEFYNNTFQGTKVNQINGVGNHWHHNLVIESRDAPFYTFQSGTGINIGSYTLSSYNNVIENNVFYRCESGGIIFTYGSDGDAFENYNHIIRNNIFYECGWGNLDTPNIAVQFKYGSKIHDISFLNNLIYNSQNTNTVFDGSYSGTYYPASVLNGNINLALGNYGTGELNITTNPNFVSDGANFKLQAGSPAINTGSPSILSTKDFDGNTIPYLTTNPDIGAYEYGYTTAPPVDATLPVWSGNNLSYTNVTQTSATLNWTAATDNIGVTGYYVYRGGALIASIGNVLTYNVTGLIESTSYSFYIKARDAAGNLSANSNTVNFTTEAEVPPPPTNVVVNGTFDSGSNWVITDLTSNISGGTMNLISVGVAASIQQNDIIVLGDVYDWSFDIVSITGSIRVNAGGETLGTFSTTGTKTGTLTINTQSQGDLYFLSNGNCNAVIDNVEFIRQ